MKFRVINKTTNKYETGFYFLSSHGELKSGNHWGNPRNHAALEDCGEELEVELFTGLTDKNGKEIYEGDILSCDHHVYDGRYKNKPRIEKVIGKIFWHHSYYAVAGYKLFIMDDDSYEVLGNIHENANLIKD